MWSPKEKVTLLLHLLRGDLSRESACRDHGIEDGELERWMEAFLRGGEQELARLRGVHDDPSSPDDRSRAELRKIIDAIPILAWRGRADGGSEFVNERWQEYTGMSEEASRDWGWVAAVHPDDVAQLTERWRAILASERPGEAEARLRSREGAYRWFLFRAAPSIDQHGGVRNWYGIQIDIEDRKRAGEMLREQERALLGIVESIPGMITVHGPTGDLEYVNRQFLDFLGVKLSELADLGWARVVHPDDADDAVTAWLRALQTHQPVDLTFRIRQAGGDYRWFHARAAPLLTAGGQIVRWYSLFWDIEDVKQAEILLSERERELRLLVESVPGMIAVADATGMHEYANKRAMDYVGKELSEVAGLGWIDDVHPDDRETVRAEWMRAIGACEPMSVEHRWRRHDGVYRWIHARVEPRFDDRGRVIRWYGLLVDIDDRRRAEQSLRQRQAELAHVTRLTSMGELTASIAHEINQPLTAILNNAQTCLALLPPGGAPAEDLRDALGDIVDAGECASGIIAKVRVLSRRTSFELTVLDLRAVVADVVALARHESAGRGVAIRTEFAADLPPVLGDRVQVQQVLLNLIVNGLDAMSTVGGSGRVLTIHAHAETSEAGAYVVIAVRDAGIGLAAGAAGRMFEAFYTTKPDGMGMGLAISRSIVEAHGGRLWAEPNQGPGATLMFTLPIAAATSRA